jgi:hypothetical protein
MSNQSTRASDPQADPRQPFALSKAEAERLQVLGARAYVAPDGVDALNAYWAELGTTHGFVWTTVEDLAWTGPDQKPELGAMREVDGATFTAWPQVGEWQPDPDAVAWLNSMVMEGKAGTLKNRELILRAFAAGRDQGFAMGTATQPQLRLGWDGMELIRECAVMLRGYEQHHRDRMAHGKTDDEAHASFTKAERNGTMADKLEAFLADPTRSHLVHDALRETRRDNETAALAGWNAAMRQVRELVVSERAQAGSAIPPLVLLARLDELPPPEDMDEVFQRLRDPMAQVDRLRAALREWLEKTDWVDEGLRNGTFNELGLPTQWGRHRADTMREVVGLLGKRLAQSLADTLAGLRVQAAADVLQAMGITGKHCTCPSGWGIEVGCPVHDAEDPAATVRTIEEAAAAGLVPGLDQERLDAIRLARDTDANGPHGDEESTQVRTRYPAAEGLKCMGKPEGEA